MPWWNTARWTWHAMGVSKYQMTEHTKRFGFHLWFKASPATPKYKPHEELRGDKEHVPGLLGAHLRVAENMQQCLLGRKQAE